jgi:hypothetical protein
MQTYDKDSNTRQGQRCTFWFWKDLPRFSTPHSILGNFSGTAVGLPVEYQHEQCRQGQQFRCLAREEADKGERWEVWEELLHRDRQPLRLLVSAELIVCVCEREKDNGWEIEDERKSVGLVRFLLCRGRREMSYKKNSVGNIKWHIIRCTVGKQCFILTHHAQQNTSHQWTLFA